MGGRAHDFESTTQITLKIRLTATRRHLRRIIRCLKLLWLSASVSFDGQIFHIYYLVLTKN